MAGKKNNTAILLYCAQNISPNLETLSKKAKNIQRRRNIEDIHDIRVSSRRVRTNLSIFENYLPQKKAKIWQRDIKGITKAFGNVRDLDVQIDLVNQIYKKVEDKSIRSGLRRIRLRLKQKRQQKQDKTQQITQNILESTTFVELQAWAKSILEKGEGNLDSRSNLYQLGYEHIQKRLDEFLFFEVFIFDPARIEELHQMRIAAKQLRYALEVFSDLYMKKTDFALDIARQSQQFLGEIHDADVWKTFLPNFMEKEYKRVQDFYGYTSPYSRLKPGIEYLLQDRTKERDRLYSEFLTSWKNWKLKETWLNLRKIIFLTNLEEQPSQTNTSDEQQEQT
jgi:CHAD domain-containing protein